jgi:hypothetical protein
VPHPDKYVPTHRAPGKHKAVRGPRRAFRTGIALTGLAAAATGVSVTGGLFSSDPELVPAAADAAPTTASAPAASGQTADAAASARTSAVLAQRAQRQVASRSSRRDATKATALTMSAGPVVTKSQNLSQGDPRDIARALLPLYGFSSDQFSCLDSLYMSESGWRIDADNPTSSAYGIPQALTQLHELPADYMTSAESQIRWGLGYIQDTYGTPCSAWSFKQGNNWY